MMISPFIYRNSDRIFFSETLPESRDHGDAVENVLYFAYCGNLPTSWKGRCLGEQEFVFVQISV